MKYNKNCSQKLFFMAAPMSITAKIVTSCTQRKSGQIQIDIGHISNTGTITQVASAWSQLVAETDVSTPARSLYKGRSITDIAAAADCAGAPWYVVSAGLGLVHSEQLIPAYECTIAPGSELRNRLNRSRKTASDWWNALSAPHPHPLSHLVKSSITLIALPSSYLEMVHDDLAQVKRADAENLRIFTSNYGARFVPDHLADCVMPYDSRLESIKNYAGTQSDFAQRALRHFVESLKATTYSLQQSREAILESLEHQPYKRRVAGKRMSDDEIEAILTDQWEQHSGSSTKLLRHLRDVAHIACEQKRFSRIWQKLANEIHG